MLGGCRSAVWQVGECPHHPDRLVLEDLLEGLAIHLRAEVDTRCPSPSLCRPPLAAEQLSNAREALGLVVCLALCRPPVGEMLDGRRELGRVSCSRSHGCLPWCFPDASASLSRPMLFLSSLLEQSGFVGQLVTLPTNTLSEKA